MLFEPYHPIHIDRFNIWPHPGFLVCLTSRGFLTVQKWSTRVNGWLREVCKFIRKKESWGKVARVQQFRRVLHFRLFELFFGRKWKSVQPCSKTYQFCLSTPACNKLLQDLSFPPSLNSLGAGGQGHQRPFEKFSNKSLLQSHSLWRSTCLSLKVKFTGCYNQSIPKL